MGIETFQFAFVTRNGQSQAPANPIDSTLATFTPDPAKDLFMNSGDRIAVATHDTANGVQVVLDDHTTGQSGSMTASGANGFAQIKHDPTGTSCQAIPYNFHPMYSTSSPQTRVIWAAHTYNVAFSDEIGHFEFCTGPNQIPATPFGVDTAGNPIACPAGNVEGRGKDTEPTDGDDNFCFPGSEALLVHVNGCTDTNTGFDGVSYQRAWPDGNTAVHPQPWLFSAYGNQLQRQLHAHGARGRPASNRDQHLQPHNRRGLHPDPTTEKVSPPPSTCSSAPSTAMATGIRVRVGVRQCHAVRNDLGRNAQYGSLLTSTYLMFGGGGASAQAHQQLPQHHLQSLPRIALPGQARRLLAVVQTDGRPVPQSRMIGAAAGVRSSLASAPRNDCFRPCERGPSPSAQTSGSTPKPHPADGPRPAQHALAGGAYLCIAVLH